MDRRSFLLRALAGVGALSLGRLPAPARAAALGVEPELVDGGTLELGVIRDSILTSTNDYQIFGPRALAASGGLVAPIEPYYSLVGQRRPVRDALPAFAADRGVKYR